MKRVNITKLFLVVALYSAVLNIHAQPAGNRILLDAIAEPAGPCDRIEVTFSFPVQYLTHSPKIHGKEVRVQVSPLAGNQLDPRIQDNSQFDRRSLKSNRFDRRTLETNPIDRQLLDSTESIRLMDSTKNQVNEISYDGTFSPNRPYLIFNFENDVYFKVVQGERFRSIVLFVSSKDNINECN